MQDPPATIVETLPHCHPQEFPNLSRAFTALSSSHQSNYREVFQCTKKTYLRSAMKEDRLSGLALLHIHKHDASFSAEDIADDFAASGNRRNNLVPRAFPLNGWAPHPFFKPWGRGCRRKELLFQLLTVTSIGGERRFFIVVLRSIS